MPPNLIGGWAVTDKNLTERPDFVRKALNALYGALEYMRNNPDYAIKMIADNNELPEAIARMEYERTFMNLSRDGQMTPAAVQLAPDMAKASGAGEMADAGEIFQNIEITPTQP
jgi:NitT/TauT family transport system substrate-binding protein